VTNAGKSFTVLGDSARPGLLKFGFQYLLDIKNNLLNDRESVLDADIKKDFLFNSSYLQKCCIFFESFEIYNEDIFDLLNNSRQKL